MNQKLGYLSLCWIVLTAHFLLSGFVRGFVFPQFSNYLFFVPLPVIICIFLISKGQDFHFQYFEFFCVIISTILLIYQIVIVLGGLINLQTAVYGWFLYGLPFLGMAAAQRSLNVQILERIILLFEFCLAPNLFFAVMQTVVGNSKYFSAGFGEGLQSANGVQRATGTFSSPAGYALYLSLTAALLFLRNDIRKCPLNRNLLSFGLLLFQVPISGSRTAIISVALVFLARILFYNRRRPLHPNNNKSKVLIAITSLFFVGFFWRLSGSSTVQATAARFVTANELDPPLTRLIAQLKIDLRGISVLYGTGLGSRAKGTTVLGVDWVEFDAQRVVIEAGLVIGLILLAIRIFLVLRVVKFILRNHSSGEVPLIAAVVPVLLFGQFMGQGTISSGTWLGLYILEYLRSQFESQNEHDLKSG